jgi:hypothetical protein
MADVSGRIKAKQKAAADLADLYRVHFELLDQISPETRRKSREIVQIVHGQRESGEEFDAIVFEGVMSSPLSYGDLLSFDFHRQSGQSEAEFSYLVDGVKAMYSTALAAAASQQPTAHGLRNRYLVDMSDASDLAKVKRQSEIGNGEASQGNVEFSWFKFWRRPGQSEEAVAKLAEKIRRDNSTARKAAGVGKSITDNLSGPTVSEIHVRQGVMTG